jgi:pyruvate formate lyase activating enzyme
MTPSDYLSDQGHRLIEKRIKTRLRIGDFFPVSTTLFNGEPATEIFFQGCPWQCRNCQHPALISPLTETTFDWQDILYYLMCRRGLIDHVVFNGAEPLSQSHVIEAIMQCKTMGFMVGLHTCGIFPLRLESVLPLIDWLWFEVLDLPEHYPDNNLSPDSGHTAWKGLQIAVDSGVPVVCELYGARESGARSHLHLITERLVSLGVQHLVLTLGHEEPTSLSDCDSDIQLLAQKFSHFNLRTETRTAR